MPGGKRDTVKLPSQKKGEMEASRCRPGSPMQNRCKSNGKNRLAKKERKECGSLTLLRRGLVPIEVGKDNLERKKEKGELEVSYSRRGEERIHHPHKTSPWEKGKKRKQPFCSAAYSGRGEGKVAGSRKKKGTDRFCCPGGKGGGEGGQVHNFVGGQKKEKKGAGRREPGKSS